MKNRVKLQIFSYKNNIVILTLTFKIAYTVTIQYFLKQYKTYDCLFLLIVKKLINKQPIVVKNILESPFF